MEPVPGRPVNPQQTVKMADTDKTAARPDTGTEADTAAPEAKPKTARKRAAGSRTRRAAKSTGSKTKAKASTGKSSQAKAGAKKRASAAQSRVKSAKAKTPAGNSASTDAGPPAVSKRTKAQNRKTLQVELERVQAELTELRSTFDGEVDIDPEEGDVEVAERTKNISLIQMLETRERQFMDALQSVEAGEYGKCKRCREPINPERLQAIPDAKYCIRCQELVERSPSRLF